MKNPQLKPKLTPLPCPFCGKAPRLAPKDAATEGGAWGAVYCNNQRCLVHPQVGDGCDVADDRGSGAYIDVAIRRWNKRAKDCPR